MKEITRDLVEHVDYSLTEEFKIEKAYMKRDPLFNKLPEDLIYLITSYLNAKASLIMYDLVPSFKQVYKSKQWCLDYWRELSKQSIFKNYVDKMKDSDLEYKLSKHLLIDATWNIKMIPKDKLFSIFYPNKRRMITVLLDIQSSLKLKTIDDSIIFSEINTSEDEMSNWTDYKLQFYYAWYLANDFDTFKVCMFIKSKLNI